jgi:hypothetical protein
MITAKEDSYEELAMGLQPKIEVMIWNSSLDDQTKEKLMRQMLSLRTNEEALAMISILEDSQPIVGMDRIPITQYEIVQATRERADREDFKERKWKSH